LTGGYGSQRSIITGCGFGGNSGNLSIMTFRGGGGSFLPLTVRKKFNLN